MTVGGLLIARKQAETSDVQVSWDWQDQNQGVVRWTFVNMGNATVSGLLFRATYPFGNAFWPIYEENPAFDTSFTLMASPLVDNGAENNSPPLAIFKNPDGSMFVAFVFTLSPGQSWSMLEGGFVDGMTPDYNGTPMFVPASRESSETFIINWVPEQCQGYNQQAGTSFPCPSNPLSVSSAVFTLPDQVSPLFHDIIQSGSQKPSCISLITDGIDTGSIDTIIEGLECAFGDVGKDIVEVLKKNGD
jgi:hypothetical protein